MVDKTEKSLRIGYDDFVFKYNLLPEGSIAVDDFEVFLNGAKLSLDEEKKKCIALVCWRLFDLRNEATYSKMREAKMKNEVFLKDLTDVIEKYYKIQLGLLLNPASASGEMENRTFEDLIKNIVLDLSYLKKEVAELGASK